MTISDLAVSAPKPLAITRSRGDSTGGGVLTETAGLLGLSLWPWQEQASDVALERRDDGRFRFPVVTISVPRQSGKTTLLAVVAVDRCLSEPGSRVFYTAQSRADAVDRWRDMVSLLRSSGVLREHPPLRWDELPADQWDFKVRRGTGEERVTFSNGSSLALFAPSEDSLHGSVTDLVILDEARFYDEPKGRALISAALPTQSSRNGQVWIVSTAGGPSSTFLRGEIDAGRASVDDPDGRRCHAEWGIGPDVADDDLLDQVLACHPSAERAGGPHRDALEFAHSEMPAGEFRREYGNQWTTVDTERLISAETWQLARARVSPNRDMITPTLAVDCAVDRSSAAIVASLAGTLELIDVRPGASWVGARVIELVGKYEPLAVVIDPVTAGPLAAELREHVPQLIEARTRDVTSACALLWDALSAVPPAVAHQGQPELDAAVAAAQRRKVGQSWAWDRNAPGGPLLLAASLALWAERHGAPEPVPVMPRPRVY